ncbi:MAG: hypothetical protein K2W95_23200 [Candidatus Obscuribacterales bacterium]|nr:hypothetical protein [Candidatus Obscuribacterales bacterium]
MNGRRQDRRMEELQEICDALRQAAQALIDFELKAQVAGVRIRDSSSQLLAHEKIETKLRNHTELSQHFSRYWGAAQTYRMLVIQFDERTASRD